MFVADVHVDFRTVAGDGDTVVVEERMQATLHHGGHYDIDYCFVFELEGERIKRVREFMDTRRGAAWFTNPYPEPDHDGRTGRPGWRAGRVAPLAASENRLLS